MSRLPMMKLLASIAVAVACSTGAISRTFAAEAEIEEGSDTSAGLPPQYAKNFLVAESTRSPNKKFAVMYPTLDFSESKEAKDYLIALDPFTLLGALPTKSPYFQSESHGGISAHWSEESTVGLITLDSKWGPGDVFLVEMAEGKIARTTNLLEKLHQLLLPNYRGAKPKPQPYNDEFDFIFEQGDEPVCELEGMNLVKIDATATTDPKGASRRSWAAQVKAVWDIRQAKFISQKISPARRARADAD